MPSTKEDFLGFSYGFRPGRIFLIVDRGSAHRAKKVSAFVHTLGGKLRLFFLPPYSPDRNPDRVGVEASESGYRRPHGDDQQK
jgi:transposase